MIRVVLPAHLRNLAKAAGEVMLATGGPIALSGGAVVTSSTAGAGSGGTVQVTAHGPLILSDPVM